MNLLIDKFSRVHSYLRISVTDRCNLRCSYCMPSCGIDWKEHSSVLTYEEITRLATLFVNLGIKKIRITGGEPIVRKNIEKLILNLSLIPGLETLAMTTNGVLLKSKAHLLKKSGLNALNISLDTLQRERFEQITLKDNFNDVIEGVYSALEAGFNPIKLNVVIMADINNDEIIDFVHFVKDKPINIRFIEYMPFKDNGWNYAKLFSFRDMQNMIQRHYNLIPIKNG